MLKFPVNCNTEKTACVWMFLECVHGTRIIPQSTLIATGRDTIALRVTPQPEVALGPGAAAGSWVQFLMGTRLPLQPPGAVTPRSFMAEAGASPTPRVRPALPTGSDSPGLPRQRPPLPPAPFKFFTNRHTSRSFLRGLFPRTVAAVLSPPSRQQREAHALLPSRRAACG